MKHPPETAKKQRLKLPPTSLLQRRSNSFMTDFTFNERLGLFIAIEASFLSAAAVSFILGLAVYKWLRRTVSSWGRGVTRSPDASDSSLFLNLMVADLIQALGNMPSIKWMMQAHITEGHLCTAQAAIKQVGIVGVAMTSLAIAVHTFAVLVLRWRAPRYIIRMMVVGVWVFVAIVIGVPNAVHRHQKYYGGTGYWCWIQNGFRAEQIVTEYLWVWVSGFTMAILYTIMFLVIRGWFIIDDGIHWHKNYTPSYPNNAPSESDEEKQTKAIARLMLFYPAVYIVCVLPNSLSRWLWFEGFNTPYQFTFFASTLFALSGTFNVILFFLTRPELVVGSKADDAEEEAVPLHQRRDSAGRKTGKFGHLPERPYTDIPVEQSDFNPTVLTNQGVFLGSPSSVTVPLPSRGSHILPTAIYHPSRQDAYSRSKESASLFDQEEDYGHLPG